MVELPLRFLLVARIGGDGGERGAVHDVTREQRRLVDHAAGQIDDFVGRAPAATATP